MESEAESAVGAEVESGVESAAVSRAGEAVGTAEEPAAVLVGAEADSAPMAAADAADVFDVVDGDGAGAGAGVPTLVLVAAAWAVLSPPAPGATAGDGVPGDAGVPVDAGSSVTGAAGGSWTDGADGAPALEVEDMVSSAPSGATAASPMDDDEPATHVDESYGRGLGW